MTGPEMVAMLHPARLPEAFTAPGWDDFLSAFGIGLVAAAALLTLIMPALHRRVRPPSWHSRLAAIARMPPAEGDLARLRLLAEAGVALPPDQRAALYAGRLDPAALDDLLRRAGRR